MVDKDEEAGEETGNILLVLCTQRVYFAFLIEMRSAGSETLNFRVFLIRFAESRTSFKRSFLLKDNPNIEIKNSRFHMSALSLFGTHLKYYRNSLYKNFHKGDRLKNYI